MTMTTTGRYRIIYGRIMRPGRDAKGVEIIGGVPWPRAPLRVRQDVGSYTLDETHPAAQDTYYADESGDVRWIQWCTEDGAVPARIHITHPDGDSFEVSVPYGDGSPISLTTLREMGVTPGDPTYPSVLALAEAALEPVAEATDRASTAADRAEAAAEPLEAERRAAEIARQGAEAAEIRAEIHATAAGESAGAAAQSATDAEYHAGQTPTVGTLEELALIEPTPPGRFCYVTEIKRPAWADGEVWRLAQGWLADLSDTVIERVVFDDSYADAILSIYPEAP